MPVEVRQHRAGDPDDDGRGSAPVIRATAMGDGPESAEGHLLRIRA